MKLTITQTLDVKGLSCPMPIVKTALAMRSMASGDIIEVLATDPGSVQDFDAWSRSTGNPIIESTNTDGVFRYVVQKM